MGIGVSCSGRGYYVFSAPPSKELVCVCICCKEMCGGLPCILKKSGCDRLVKYNLCAEYPTSSFSQLKKHASWDNFPFLLCSNLPYILAFILYHESLSSQQLRLQVLSPW